MPVRHLMKGVAHKPQSTLTRSLLADTVWLWSAGHSPTKRETVTGSISQSTVSYLDVPIKDNSSYNPVDDTDQPLDTLLDMFISSALAALALGVRGCKVGVTCAAPTCTELDMLLF